MRFQDIQYRIQNSKNVDFGKILDQSIKLFKEIWLTGFLMILILIVLGAVTAFLLVAIGLIPNPYDVAGYENYSFFNSYTRSSITNLPQTLLVTPIAFGMLSGFYRLCKQFDLKVSQKDDLFYFFRGDYFKKVFLLGIIYALIASVAQALLLLPYVYAFIPLSYFSVIFANNPELSETEIVKLSFSLGTKKWFVTFGLMFITGLIGMVGLLACGIGVMFTMSIVYLPVYFIYRDVVGFEDDNEIQYIGEE